MPTYRSLWPTYARQWDSMKVRPSRLKEFQKIAKRLFDAKERYVSVQDKTGVPWYVIAIIHEREASQNWNTQLAQGDPLHRRSVHIPRGMGPYSTWEQGAIAAIKHDGLDLVQDWRIEKTLYRWEAFNGWGYHNHGVPSAYVWAGSTIYTRGKYVADGVWSPFAVDTQPGCAPLLKCLMDLDPTIVLVRETYDTKAAVPATEEATHSFMSAEPTQTQPSKGNSMLDTLIAMLANFMPGMKTKIWSSFLMGSGALLALMQYLQTIDLTQWVPPQYYGIVVMVIGMITYFLRSITKTVDTPSAVIVPSTLASESIVTVKPV